MSNSRPVHDTAIVRRRIADEIPRTVVSTGRKQPASGEQSRVVRALCWLGGRILEGCAIYGELVCPCILDFPASFRHHD
jgi:hypothetical protein